MRSHSASYLPNRFSDTKLPIFARGAGVAGGSRRDVYHLPRLQFFSRYASGGLEGHWSHTVLLLYITGSLPVVLEGVPGGPQINDGDVTNWNRTFNS